MTAAGHCLIVACPGSGKTTVLQHRAAHLLSQAGATVVAVTFTSDAAKELEERIRKVVPDAANRLTCGTFHSLCKRQIEQGYAEKDERDALAAGKKPNSDKKKRRRIKLVNENQQLDLVRRAFEEEIGYGNGITLETIQRFIESVKSTIDPILASPNEDVRVAVYHRYQQMLMQMGAMDFSDLLNHAVYGMRDGSLSPYPAKYLLVDEAQDTDPIQFAWVREHIRQGTLATVVGDDDQAIYSWRGAEGYSNFQSFKAANNALQIALDVTYRCPREVLAPAGILIGLNENRVQKSLVTMNRDVGVVRVRRYANRDDEFTALMQAIVMSGEPDSWGVLARTNSILEQFEQAVGGLFPVNRKGGSSFWDNRGPQMMVDACRSLVFGDMVGLDNILRRSGAGEEQLAQLHRRYDTSSQGAFERFLRDKGSGSMRDPVDRLRTYAAKWRESLQKGRVLSAVNGVGQYIIKYARFTHQEMRGQTSADVRQQIECCVLTLGKSMKGSLGERLMTLQQKKDEPDENETGAVRLMTMHSSKGLEFDRVWILGCEQGVIPSRQSPLEEERRLLYVAITRSRGELTLSCQDNEFDQPSRLLEEAGLI